MEKELGGISVPRAMGKTSVRFFLKSEDGWAGRNEGRDEPKLGQGQAIVQGHGWNETSRERAMKDNGFCVAFHGEGPLVEVGVWTDENT